MEPSKHNNCHQKYRGSHVCYIFFSCESVDSFSFSLFLSRPTHVLSYPEGYWFFYPAGCFLLSFFLQSVFFCHCEQVHVSLWAAVFVEFAACYSQYVLSLNIQRSCGLFIWHQISWLYSLISLLAIFPFLSCLFMQSRSVLVNQLLNILSLYSVDVRRCSYHIISEGWNLIPGASFCQQFGHVVCVSCDGWLGRWNSPVCSSVLGEKIDLDLSG